MLEKTRTLMLNSDFSAFSVTPTKDAITRLFKERSDFLNVFVVENYSNKYILTSGGDKYSLPAVVASRVYIHRNKISYSRKNVFIRDEFTCQYCHKKFHHRELTIDHLIPRKILRANRIKKQTHFENVVTACRHCNIVLKKAHRLEDTDLKLLKEPTEPKNPKNFILGLSPWSKIHPIWEPYLPDLYKNYQKQHKLTV